MSGCFFLKHGVYIPQNSNPCRSELDRQTQLCVAGAPWNEPSACPRVAIMIKVALCYCEYVRRLKEITRSVRWFVCDIAVRKTCRQQATNAIAEFIMSPIKDAVFAIRCWCCCWCWDSAIHRSSTNDAAVSVATVEVYASSIDRGLQAYPTTHASSYVKLARLILAPRLLFPAYPIT